SRRRARARAGRRIHRNQLTKGKTMSKDESNQIEAALDKQMKLARRKKLFAALGGTVLVAGLCYGAYSHFYLARFVTTDNAYTAAETAQVTPSVSGIVRDVRVVDTQRVKQGEIVAMLDDTDAQLALSQAEAELGRAIRKVRGYAATDRSLAAQVAS